MIEGIKQVSKEDAERLQRYLNVHCGKELQDVAGKALELNVQHAEFSMKDGSIWTFICPRLAQFYSKVKEANLSKKKSTNDGDANKDATANEQDADVENVGKE